MTIKENISLAGLTTFRIGGPARFFCAVGTPGELEEAAAFAKGKSLPIFILGGGSNILVSDKGFDGLVIKIEIKGIEEFENKGGILVKAGAGEDWDAFVKWTVERGLGGLGGGSEQVGDQEHHSPAVAPGTEPRQTAFQVRR